MALDGLVLQDDRGFKYKLVRLASSDAAFEKTSKMGFGKWLSDERKRLNLTQEELVNILGIAQPNISAYEKGRRRPRRETEDTIRRKLSAISID